MSSTASPLKAFLQDHHCLIVEPSQTFAAGIQACLHGMGIPMGQVLIVRRFSEAKKIVEEKRPRLIITEYEVENNFGMALAEIQEKQFEDSGRISFIITKNASASAVAEAAEGQIDGYLVKPFPIEAFRAKLTEILDKKLNPSDYSRRISSGKALFAQGEFEKAIEEFLQAKTLSTAPALACFYAGSIFESKGQMERAVREYKEGRSHQPLHYKCLVGEFEGQIHLRNYQEAYSLMESIFKNYPITSKRLGQMFVAAVFTGNFQDLPVLYGLFSQLEQRTPELVEISSMALMTAGKFFLRKNDFVTAAEHFEMGVKLTRRDFTYLQRIISEFIQLRALEQAEFFLSRVLEDDVIKPEYSQLQFRVDEMSFTREQIVERGRKLVLAGQGTPEIFELVVRSMAEIGKETLAEAMIGKALETHPQLRQSLYQILDEELGKRKKKA